MIAFTGRRSGVIGPYPPHCPPHPATSFVAGGEAAVIHSVPNPLQELPLHPCRIPQQHPADPIPPLRLHHQRLVPLPLPRPRRTRVEHHDLLPIPIRNRLKRIQVTRPRRPVVVHIKRRLLLRQRQRRRNDRPDQIHLVQKLNPRKNLRRRRQHHLSREILPHFRNLPFELCRIRITAEPRNAQNIHLRRLRRCRHRVPTPSAYGSPFRKPRRRQQNQPSAPSRGPAFTAAASSSGFCGYLHRHRCRMTSRPATNPSPPNRGAASARKIKSPQLRRIPAHHPCVLRRVSITLNRLADPKPQPDADRQARQRE